MFFSQTLYALRNLCAMLTLFLYPAAGIFWPEPKTVELQELLY